MIDKKELRMLAEKAAMMHPTFAENAEAYNLYAGVLGPDVFLALLNELDACKSAMQMIAREVDGNIRPTVRDVIKGMPDANDIYDYCENIEMIIHSTLVAIGDV